MKLKSEETKDIKGFKHKIKRGENYFLTIFDDSGIKTINISKLNKKLITFGNGKNNDITISSDIIATRQGYFEITEYGVLAVNTTKGIFMKGTDNRIYDEIYLAEGSFIKITSRDNDSTKGILIVMSIGRNLNEWKEYSLKLGRNTLGSEKNNDIVLPSKGIAKKHASIYYFRNNITIADEGSLNGIYINRKKILPSKNKKIENLDVILIGNSKIVVFGDKLIYQLSESGVQVDALDIVKKVRVKFKTQEIASHTSMTIKPSEFVAFVGGSGAGKSTFMKCISGVDRPTSGKVLINGENLYDNYDELKSNIGYVPQEDIVYSNLTLHDTLQYAAKLRMPDNTTRKERNIRIKEVLEIVQLTELENSYIRQLSGGQRKRASIAVELIADPNLFFLDEPTSGLDPGTERSIMLTLRKMAEMGKTVILVTHNTLNLHLCDKVAFFGKGGKLCFFGRPKDALEFFGVDDFVDIYTLLNEDVELWYNKFKSIEENIKVDIVGGTSIGSIVAALYAMEYTPKEMLKLFNYFSKLIFKNSAMYTDPRGKKLLSIQAGGLYSGENIAFAIEEAGKYKNIKKLQDLKIPIVIPAVDLRDSEKYVFTNMGKINDKYLNKADISIAVRASSSYPAIFAPCIYNKHKFVDGGILDNIPVEEVKKIGADKVIAVRFKLNKTSRTIGLRSTLNKAIDIMFSKIEGEEVKKADYVIEIDTQDVNPFDFKQSNKCYKYGYLQTKKEIANIKKMIYKED